MSYGSSFPRRVTEDKSDGENRLLDVCQIAKIDGSVETEHIWGPEPEPTSFTLEHDERRRLFVVTWPDGRTERFGDNPGGT